jgi:MATE family multidrug resistance protein
MSLFGALRGLKDTHFTLLISILTFWGIALPLGYLLATYFHLAGTGLWWVWF